MEQYHITEESLPFSGVNSVDYEQEFIVDINWSIYLLTFFVSGIVSAVLRLTFIHPKKSNMTSHQFIHEKALELGISVDIVTCALQIISQNRNLVNAIDNGVEMDDYIYRIILKQAFELRMAAAEKDFYSGDEAKELSAQKDLKILAREELTSDAFYRAVLPLIVKTLHHEPIRRLHAEEASSIIMKLAECKRRFRALTFTELIVKKCSAGIESFQAA